MTGYLTTAGGEIWRLPELLEWELLRTDGDGCDSAEVLFRYEPARLDVLKNAVFLRLEEDGKTAYYGVIDEFLASVGDAGRLVRLQSRGLAALLMDSQLRAAEFSSFGEKDAVSRLVTPFGIEKVTFGNLPAVRNFSWSTAATPWQVLCGYCRHAGGKMPRFAADGTLLLQPNTPRCWTLTDACAYTDTCLRYRRYGVIAQQVTVSSGGRQDVAENPVFRQLGGSTQKVSTKTGKTLRATWRTAQQQVEDSMDGAVTLTVSLSQQLDAEPGDTVELSLDRGGFSGTYVLKSLRRSCSRQGRKTVLVLEGRLG